MGLNLIKVAKWIGFDLGEGGDNGIMKREKGQKGAYNTIFSTERKCLEKN